MHIYRYVCVYIYIAPIFFSPFWKEVIFLMFPLLVKETLIKEG